MSVGSRSLVNCTREKRRPSETASAWASVVLPTPGRSSISRWPPASRQVTLCRIATSFPRMTSETWAIRASSSRGMGRFASVDSQDGGLRRVDEFWHAVKIAQRRPAAGAGVSAPQWRHARRRRVAHEPVGHNLRPDRHEPERARPALRIDCHARGATPWMNQSASKATSRPRRLRVPARAPTRPRGSRIPTAPRTRWGRGIRSRRLGSPRSTIA